MKSDHETKKNYNTIISKENRLQRVTECVLPKRLLHLDLNHKQNMHKIQPISKENCKKSNKDFLFFTSFVPSCIS